MSSDGDASPTVADAGRGIVAEPMNGFEVLEKIAGLPISTWNYAWEPASVRHVGPMAQDFYAAFGLGDSDKHIFVVDANGVALVAIQALHRRLQELEAEVAALRAAAAAPE